MSSKLASFIVALLGLLALRSVAAQGDRHQIVLDTAQQLDHAHLFDSTAMSHRNAVYYVNWAIYARKHRPQDLPIEHLTHVLYAFANVKPDSGEVFLTDQWADQEIHYDGDSWNDPGTNLYGCLKQLLLLKQRKSTLKVLLSIGGWTYSSNFAPMACDQTKRATFVRTAIGILEDYGLDGLDVDWEYPKNDGEAQDYVALLAELREALDRHAQQKGDRTPYELTIAAPCGSDTFKPLRVAEMECVESHGRADAHSRYLTAWNLMAYDYAGSWSSTAEHHANLRGPADSTERAVNFYRSQGVHPAKLVIGMPLYGRTFTGTRGRGHPFSGVGKGTWELGLYDYKTLPLPGSQVGVDEQAVAAWCHDGNEWVSYDTRETAETKADWIRSQGLGGAMYWESSGDRNDSESIITAVARKLDLEQSPNHLRYPESRFENVRKMQ